jgi:hypothetical protein
LVVITLLAIQGLRTSRAFKLNEKADWRFAQPNPFTAVEQVDLGLGAVAQGEPAGVQLWLSAARTTTSWNAADSAPTKFELPLLTLRHERAPTAAPERTLDITITGLPSATQVQIEVISRHLDVSTSNRHRGMRSFLLPERPCTLRHPCSVQWTFDPKTTPSDFYALWVSDQAGAILWKSATPERPDFVALDTWDVTLDAYIIRVLYAQLFSFARGIEEVGNRLSPAKAVDFIERQFVPIIQETWQTQFHEWGFGDPIHPDWDRDKVVEIIVTPSTLALMGGTGTYTVFQEADNHPYLERRLWWRSRDETLRQYDSLENACRVLFAHEFFHLGQWNVLLSTGQPTGHGLNLFIEAQGKFAPSVQYPELELSKQHVITGDSAYIHAANRFLTHRLNSSYQDLEAEQLHKYDAALYWRFLYERFDGIGISRAALEEMAIRYDRDSVASFARSMDAAFARRDGPYRTFAESLVAFARANYALRLENGRCTTSNYAECGGCYYDPDQMYVDPPLAAVLDHDGSHVAHTGAIPSSYGMDFIEVRLDPAMQNQPLTIRFTREAATARFHVQVWKLAPGGRKPRGVTRQPEAMVQTAEGEQVYSITRLDTETYDRLALIITRIDSDEAIDATGSYRVRLEG